MAKVIGRVEIKVSASVDNSRPQMQREMERDLDSMERRLNRRRPIKIPVDIDKDEFERKLRDVEREAERSGRKLKIQADLDDTQARKDLDDLRNKLKNMASSKVKLELDKRDVERKLKEIENRTSTIDSHVKVSEESIAKAKQRVDKFKDEAENDINMGVDLHGLALAGARLSWLTRPRTVSIVAKVDAKAAAVAIGILRSLAGVNTLQKFGQNLERIVTDFDQFAASIVKVMGLVGNLTNVLGYMGTTLFTVGGGIMQITGLAAILPTLASSLLAVFGVVRIGFNNFAESFSEIPEVAEAALEKLPPKAREARDALVGVFKDFQDPIQDLFWENMGDSMTEFVEVIVPRVKRGMLEITPAVAGMVSDMMDSFAELARNKSLDTMFDNLRDGLEEARKGVKPFFDAINILGLRGSDFLERMGRSLGTMGNDFHDFIEQAERMGDIERWINGGLEALKDTWGVVIALKDQMKALTQIFDAAGGSSLDTFRQNMESWARTMEGEPFRSRMIRIFRGARDGASELNVGFKELLATTGEMSYEVEALQVLLGKIGSEALERISDIIGRPMLAAGLLNGLQEVQAALKILTPAAKNIGDVLGSMFDIAGDSILGVAPMLNQITEILRTIVLDLAPSLKATIPTLTSFLRNFIEIFGGSLELATTILGNVLDVVNSLPGPVRDMALAFGTFLALRGRLGGMLTALDGFWNKQRTSMAGGVAVVSSNAQKFEKAYTRMGDAVTNSSKRIGPALKNGGLHFLYGTGDRYQAEFNKMSTAAEKGAGRIEKTVGRIRTAGTNIGKALGGIMAFGGGLGGALLFTAIIAGISAIGAAARKEKEAVADLRSTLDEFGDATEETREKVATWLQDTKTAGFDNLIQGFESVGIAASEAVDALSGDQADFDGFFSRLQRGYSDVTAEIDRMTQQAAANGKLVELENDTHYRGLIDQQRGYHGLISEVEKFGGRTQKARDQQQEVAKALGVTNQESKDLQTALNTLGNEYKSGADKADAMQRALDILNGTMREQDDAIGSAADALRNLKDHLAQVAKDKISLKDMIDLDTGKIDISFQGDPTGVFKETQEAMQNSVTRGINVGMERANNAPPEGKLAAFRAGFEDQLRDLRAMIVPMLGENGDLKFDAWLQSQGWDEATIEALVTGQLDEAQIASLPPEVKALFDSAFGSDPANIPIDGDYLPLQGKMSVAEAMLTKLGAVETNPKIGADGEKLDKTTKTALEKLREIQNADTKAIIDGDIQPFTEKEQTALRKLMEIDSLEAIPTFDADGKPLALENQIALAMLLGFDKKEAEATLKANKKDVDEKTSAAQKKIDSTKQKTPIKLDANGNPLKDQTKRSQADIDAIKQKNKPKVDANTEPAKSKVKTAQGILRDFDRTKATATATAQTYGTGAVSNLAALIRGLRSKTITVTTNYKQRGAGPTKNTALADGGIMFNGRLKTFADGGFSSKPTSAHIAPAGSYVMYAERETGGEAFIPLAASKRARSERVLQDVAKRFGWNVSQYADGGVTATTTNTTGASVSIGQMITSDPQEAIRELRRSQAQAQALLNAQGV
jgi:phage-related protein